MRSLAAFDLDGTLTRKNSSFAFIRFLCKKRFFSKRDLLLCFGYYLSHRFFSLSLLKLHQKVLNALFQGKFLAEITPYLEAFIEEELPNLWYHPARHRLHLLKQEGAHIMLLSNSPAFLVHPLAATLGIERAYGTEYQLDSKGGFVTVTSLIDGKKKAELLQNEAAGLKIGDTFAFSDSLLDLPFLRSAKRAVAVRPGYTLKRLAQQYQWEIL